MADFEIRAEYTGNEPNIRPAASAFVRMIKKEINPDGTFTDPDLEAEYQDWIKNAASRDQLLTTGEAFTNETP